MKHTSKLTQFFSILKASCLLLSLFCFFLLSISQVRNEQIEKGRQHLEDSLRLSAMSCYAIEGIYPPTLGYLEEHYGILINKEQYAVFYEVFADNLMPAITVVNIS